jgi:hypothetical protein
VCQLHLATGEFELAEPLALELYDLTRDAGDVVTLVSGDHYLSDCAMHRGDYTLAEQHRLGALAGSIQAGIVGQQAIEILCLACITAGLGRDEDALRLEGAVDAKWKELGVPHGPPLTEAWRESELGPARARLGEAQATALFEEGRSMTWDQAIELALQTNRPL